MEEEKLRELEAAQAETVRKLASAQRAADRADDHSDWVNAPSARSWQLYHVFHGQIDFGGAETAYYSSDTM